MYACIYTTFLYCIVLSTHTINMIQTWLLGDSRPHVFNASAKHVAVQPRIRYPGPACLGNVGREYISSLPLQWSSMWKNPAMVLKQSKNSLATCNRYSLGLRSHSGCSGIFPLTCFDDMEGNPKLLRRTLVVSLLFDKMSWSKKQPLPPPAIARTTTQRNSQESFPSIVLTSLRSKVLWVFRSTFSCNLAVHIISDLISPQQLRASAPSGRGMAKAPFLRPRRSSQWSLVLRKFYVQTLVLGSDGGAIDAISTSNHHTFQGKHKLKNWNGLCVSHSLTHTHTRTNTHKRNFCSSVCQAATTYYFLWAGLHDQVGISVGLPPKLASWFAEIGIHWFEQFCRVEQISKGILILHWFLPWCFLEAWAVEFNPCL